MGWLQSLAAEFAITMADATVWLAIGQGLLVGAVCLLFGIWVARYVGLRGHTDVGRHPQPALPVGAAAHNLSRFGCPSVGAKRGLVLKDNGIDYIYADTMHPSSLVPDAIPIATSGKTQCFASPDYRAAVDRRQPTV